MWGATASTAQVATIVNVVKKKRHILSSTMAANFQSASTAPASSSSRTLSVITLSSFRIRPSSRCSGVTLTPSSSRLLELGFDLNKFFLFSVFTYFKVTLLCNANIAQRMNCVSLRHGPEVIFLVKNVGDDWLALHLLFIQLLHLLLDLDSGPVDGLPRPVHPQDPGPPLEEDHLDPVGHVVSLHHPVVVVEDHDGGHHGARHHEHDGVEVGSWQNVLCQVKHSVCKSWNLSQARR